MKRLLRSLLLAAILSALLCVGALAADGEPVKGGIYNITGSVTLTPKDASGSSIPAGTDTSISGDYYANAVKFDVKAENLTENQQYLLLVLKGGADGSAPGVPTAENIAYIDQAAAQNGSVSFAAYPKELTKGTYHVYLVGADKPFAAENPAATFQYDKKYKLGDVDGNNNLSVNDALFVLQAIAHTRTLEGTAKLAADADKNGNVSVNDALFILQAIAHTRTLE